VDVGGNATFTVSAGGTAPLSYQWLFNGATINGATAASLALNSVQLSQAGQYAVKVSNSAGNVTSSAATLTVNTPSTTTLSIGSVTTTLDGFILSWTSVPGAKYAVVAADAVGNATWTAAAEVTAPANGGSVSVKLPKPANQNAQFYKIKLVTP
jgi:hypothetical protein